MSTLPARVRHVTASVPGFKNSLAYLSGATQENVDRAVIFIHGFKGKAKSTWADFASLIENNQIVNSWWERSDLYFYHYWWDSMFLKASRNKLNVLRFIKTVFPEPPETIFSGGTIQLRTNFRYKEMTLVGHSEGGLLIRKVIIDAATSDPDIQRYVRQSKTKQGAPGIAEPAAKGLLEAKIRLFAPAIGGETITGTLGILSRTPILSVFTGSIPAKLSLGSTSSAITSTRSATDEFAGYLEMECLRAHILWADRDSIIEPEKYIYDLECDNPPPGSTHSSICKPTMRYLRPISFVEEGVVDGKC
jgi:hypothetical protein